jgi:cytochrome b6-f complex iron-sulfur subunit
MEKISRYTFLRQLGFGGPALLAALCLGESSCKSSSNSNSAGAKDFTLDLNQSAFSKLKTPGNYIIEQDVVVACTSPGNYAAVTVICSHEGQKKVFYQAASNDFKCTAHSAVYDTQGKGKSGPSSGGLRTYNTALSGSSLRIFS